MNQLTLGPLKRDYSGVVACMFIRRIGAVEKGKLAQQYKAMSPEDQRTFNRWLKANTIVGVMLAAGLVAMALAGSNSVGRRDGVAADRTNGVIVSEQLGR